MKIIKFAQLSLILLFVVLPLGLQADERNSNENYLHDRIEYKVAQSGKTRDTRTAIPRKKDRSNNTRDNRLTHEQRVDKIEPFMEWMIGANKAGNVDAVLVSGATGKSFYNLKNLEKIKFLQYEKQGAARGINLGWTNNASAKTATDRARWVFVPESHLRNGGDSVLRQQPIKYGEKVAIAWVDPKSKGRWNSKASFIKRSNRNVGIDLDWSESPVYEWTVIGGKPGTRVKRGKDKIVIYNLRKKQPLVYFPRKVGGQLGWAEQNGGSVLPGMGVVVKRRELPPLDVWKGLMMEDAKRSIKR